MDDLKVDHCYLQSLQCQSTLLQEIVCEFVLVPQSIF